jgi:hypothetical protein
MLAAKRSTKKSSGPRSGAPGDSILSLALRRMGGFALSRPGTVALMLLFGGLGVVVSINALWMQSDRHPAPLFRQASLAPQHGVTPPKRASELPVSAPDAPSAAASSPAPQDTEAALPPSRPTVLAHGEAASPPQAKSPPARHTERDPLADLIGGGAPVPPAPIRPASLKPQATDKAPHAQAPANDAIAGLIEQTAKGR